MYFLTLFLTCHFLSLSISHSLCFSLSHTHTLDGPEINCLNKIQVKENEKLPSCAVGNPPPKVFWTRGNNMVIQEEPLSRNQGGLYTVLAKNDAGRTANQTVDVEVLCKKTSINFFFLYHYLNGRERWGRIRR